MPPALHITDKPQCKEGGACKQESGKHPAPHMPGIARTNVCRGIMQVEGRAVHAMSASVPPHMFSHHKIHQITMAHPPSEALPHTHPLTLAPGQAPCREQTHRDPAGLSPRAYHSHTYMYTHAATLYPHAHIRTASRHTPTQWRRPSGAETGETAHSHRHGTRTYTNTNSLANTHTRTGAGGYAQGSDGENQCRICTRPRAIQKGPRHDDVIACQGDACPGGIADEGKGRVACRKNVTLGRNVLGGSTDSARENICASVCARVRMWS